MAHAAAPVAPAQLGLPAMTDRREILATLVVPAASGNQATQDRQAHPGIRGIRAALGIPARLAIPVDPAAMRPIVHVRDDPCRSSEQIAIDRQRNRNQTPEVNKAGNVEPCTYNSICI